MRSYMVIVYGDGVEAARFFNSLDAAEKYRQDAECGLGFYTEVYERKDHEYVFLYS